MNYTCLKQKLNKYILTCVILAVSYPGGANQSINDYLLKPTGKYGAAFKDIHWINNNACPDPHFSKKNQENFSSDNKKYCHELMVRMYYPTSIRQGTETSYYQPLIATEQNRLKSIPTVKLKDIEQLSQLKSHTIENASIVKKKSFPVVLLISGLGGHSQFYENLITQLVSEGYIVLGINSLFISGDIVLPNNKVVSSIGPENWDVVTKQTLPLLEHDISFVYKKIHEIRHGEVFRAMDLKHIGAIGHSVGGRAMANVAKRHKKWFQALITLDMEVHMGSYNPQNSMMPTMHIIAADWRKSFNWFPLKYSLNKNSYLVTLSPNPKNSHYSYHMNFTDLSTLQYLPAYRSFFAHNRNIGKYLGTGNGVEITKALNLYIEGFFNAFLKNKKIPFKNCKVLTNNTYMQCGPGIF
ncbi:TPA: hypothetical protein JBE48_04810 [Legionella pneumophila subsp. pneumophila]|nr:hypothetical protein [Legionella pneumophila subsp. pneumophila]